VNDRERREKAREADETLRALFREKLEANRSRFVLTDAGRLERAEKPDQSPQAEERDS
jgi:hypothetical protein